MRVIIADSLPASAESLAACCAIRWPHREAFFATTPEDFLLQVGTIAPDLAILDSQLAHGQGHAVCREVRRFSAVPLLMVIPTDQEDEVVKALEAGADDCVARPLRPLEVVARLVALLRRTHRLPLVSAGAPFTAGPLLADFDSGEVRVAGQEVKLTSTEFAILKCLVHNPKRIVSNAQLAAVVWGEEAQGSRKALKVHIQHLRQKLGEHPGQPHYIVNERGYGYRFAAG
jgi:two-component system KDP operon response regulator KdpE